MAGLQVSEVGNHLAIILTMVILYLWQRKTCCSFLLLGDYSFFGNVSHGRSRIFFYYCVSVFIVCSKCTVDFFLFSCAWKKNRDNGIALFCPCKFSAKRQRATIKPRDLMVTLANLAKNAFHVVPHFSQHLYFGSIDSFF